MKFKDLFEKSNINEAPIVQSPETLDQHSSIKYEEQHVSKEEIISVIKDLDPDEVDFLLDYIEQGLEDLYSIYDYVDSASQEELDSTTEEDDYWDYEYDGVEGVEDEEYDIDTSDVTERPKAIIKATKLKKLQRYHKTSKFRNVVKRLNARERRSAAGMKKKRLRKRYMKRYVLKNKGILKLKQKKYKAFNK